MKPPFQTVVIGFGMIGAGFADDPVMAQHCPYATHAQVLSDHPLFHWRAVIDPSVEALHRAGDRWKIPIRSRTVEELPKDFAPDIAIIATPPEHRLEIIRSMPSLRAVLVEKPLGVTFAKSLSFVEACKDRELLVQVNFWRRGDRFFQKLAAGDLENLVGDPYAVFGLYGNGLVNNGSHMVDLVRMLFGEIGRAEVLSEESAFFEGPIRGDRNVPFMLILESGLNVIFQAIPFGSYREVGIDIWGERGRLSLYQESLGLYYYPRKRNRGIQDEWEIASDEPKVFVPTCGDALYAMYSNLADALSNGAELWSSGEEALITERIVHELAEPSPLAANNVHARHWVTT